MFLFWQKTTYYGKEIDPNGNKCLLELTPKYMFLLMNNFWNTNVKLIRSQLLYPVELRVLKKDTSILNQFFISSKSIISSTSLWMPYLIFLQQPSGRIDPGFSDLFVFIFKIFIFTETKEVIFLICFIVVSTLLAHDGPVITGSIGKGQ